jgi:hypothetical protein
VLYWLAAETGVTEILTVDVSDFSRYCLPRGKAFTLSYQVNWQPVLGQLSRAT